MRALILTSTFNVSDIAIARLVQAIGEPIETFEHMPATHTSFSLENRLRANDISLGPWLEENRIEAVVLTDGACRHIRAWTLTAILEATPQRLIFVTEDRSLAQYLSSEKTTIDFFAPVE